MAVLLVAARADAAAALVAGADELYVVRGVGVLTLDTAGRVIRRCAALEALPERSADARPRALDADDVLRLAGLPDDDTGSTEAEDLLQDEGYGARARRADPSPPLEVRMLAAEATVNRVWIATSSGLYRSDREGCAVTALAGRDLRRVAAGDGIVAAADDRLLWRVAADGAVRARVVGLGSAPRALAVEPGATVLVADDEGLLEVGPSGESTRLLNEASDAVAVCDGRALALTRDGTYAWTPGNPPLRRGPRVPARALACGRSPEVRFIATGDGVWTSEDGISWREHGAWIGRRVVAAAAGRDRVWLLVDDRVVAMDEPAAPRSAAADETFETPAARQLAPIDTRRWTAPVVPWPELGLLFAAQRTPTRFGWAIELVVAFPLGRRGIHRADRRGVALELVRRDRALAAVEGALSLSADDESLALRSALAAERQALR